MKKVVAAAVQVVAAAMLVLGVAQVQAAPCVSDTLANYIALGGGGCQIGSNTASEFAALDTIPTGATAVAPANILVTPVFSGPLGFGFDFGLNLGPTPGAFLDFLVSYRVTGSSYFGASLLVDGVPPNDGLLTGITDLCPGGTFPGGVGTCTGALLQLVAAQFPGDPPQTDQKSFPPAGSLAVITDVGIETGSVGTLSLVSVGNRFLIAPTAIPAPSVLALLIAGLGGLGLSRRFGRRVRRDGSVTSRAPHLRGYQGS